MPTNGKIQIAQGVEFNVLAREWRCKWSSDKDGQSLSEIGKLLDSMKDELLGLVYEWNRTYPKVDTNECLNGKKDTSKMGIQRIVCGECQDFKLVIKMPVDKFKEWEANEFKPEAKFLAGLKEIDGIDNVETQTYTLEVVNLMGPVKVPKPNNLVKQ
eukprot:gnl/TRDRNA2_/TRDRNA2_185994_c0_seq1.p1 gnl/TRDRNA2_/TRDRNA2_185994_c0~~gnl/TRDRNA2_/TRDRNA2_185994_c0_seq1.p1  ORF type:complete len:157 (-),score=49.45 gnl/TRDRNA2_/TRDRNA2_185994_c0_seq1:68-538(-)